MAEIWIIGRKATLPNGHEYITEPFIAFESNVDAQAACDMMQKVSGERPGIASGALYRVGETARPTEAAPPGLSPPCPICSGMGSVNPLC